MCKVVFATTSDVLGFSMTAVLYLTGGNCGLRYDTRCYFNMRSKADISQLNLPHGTDN